MQGLGRDFPQVRDALVHICQDRLQKGHKLIVAGRTSQATQAFEVLLGESAVLTDDSHGLRCFGRLSAFDQKIRQRKAVRVGNSLSRGTGLTQIKFMDLVIYNLSQMNRRRFVAKITFEGVPMVEIYYVWTA